MTYDTTYRHFKPRLEAMANTLRELVGEGEVWENDCCGDDAGFDLTIGEGNDPNGIDVTIKLLDAAEFEGCPPDRQGNVELMAVKFGGLILGQIAPYNYTPDVWVPLAPRGWSELEDRLTAITNSLPAVADRVKAELAARPVGA